LERNYLIKASRFPQTKSTSSKETEVTLFLPVLKNAILIEDKKNIQKN